MAARALAGWLALGLAAAEPGDGVYDVVVIGGGAAGLQAGVYLQEAGLRHVVLERESEPGHFWRKFPRGGELISFNKRHTIYKDKEVQLRWDWNSLLTGDDGARQLLLRGCVTLGLRVRPGAAPAACRRRARPASRPRACPCGTGALSSRMRTGTELPFRNFSKRLFPKREEMADYLTAFHAAFLQDSVQFGFEVSEGSLVKRSDGLFEVSGRRRLGGPLGADTPAAPLEQRLVARRVVMATGNGADYLPPIPVSGTARLQTIFLAGLRFHPGAFQGAELAESYWNVPWEEERYEGKAVLVIGATSSPHRRPQPSPSSQTISSVEKPPVPCSEARGVAAAGRREGQRRVRAGGPPAGGDLHRAARLAAPAAAGMADAAPRPRPRQQLRAARRLPAQAPLGPAGRDDTQD